MMSERDFSSDGDGHSTDMEVVFAPDYTQYNPYQKNLEAALEELNINVETVMGLSPKTLRELACADNGVLHLHWLFPYFQAENGLRLVINAAWFYLKLLLLKAAGVKLVWTAHDYISHSRENERLSMIFRRLVLPLFDAIIVHCDAAKDRLHEEYGLNRDYTDRMITIPHPHFLDYPNTVDRSSARAKLNLNNEDQMFLFFGNVKEYKGITELINAFDRIEDKYTRLYIAGNPTSSLESKVKAAVAEDDRIFADLRYVPNEEIQHYLKAADAVVLPFRDILTSGSVVLAMSFGKAVVAPAIGCIPETVADGGAALYDPNTEDGLYEALLAARDRDLSAMGRRNRDRIRRIDWEIAAKKTLTIYKRFN